jgi:hypothetical protein
MTVRIVAPRAFPFADLFVHPFGLVEVRLRLDPTHASASGVAQTSRFFLTPVGEAAVASPGQPDLRRIAAESVATEFGAVLEAMGLSVAVFRDR